MIQTHRGIVVARNGVAASSQPLATAAGLEVLQQPGTTFADAAIAMSAVLAVVEPYASHIGGDAFVIVYDAARRKTLAFNASGAAPARATVAEYPHGIPIRGLRAATVPGLVDCWFRLSEYWGTRSMSTLLNRATSYAAGGFPASGRYAKVFGAQADLQPDWFPIAADLLAGTQRPKRGEWIRQPDLAWTLSEIASGGRDAFYDGPITERLIAFSDANGGLFAREDFARYKTQISEPIRTDYRGFTIHGQPPVSQGHILLQELNLLEGFDLAGTGWGTADAIHLMVEAKKMAFADRFAYLGDPAVVSVPIERLLSKDYAAARRSKIDRAKASDTVNAGEIDHDTTYFCVADRHGNAASFIQSVFHGFGCGVVAEGTGVLFNNRLTGFSLDPASPNRLEPNKRPAHTLNAYIVSKGDRLAWVGGTPGGDVQVQSNMQVICNAIDFGMNPQEAIEAPRWQHGPQIAPSAEAGNSNRIAEGAATVDTLQIENRYSDSVLQELEDRGHQVQAIGPWEHGSSYQLIAVDEDGIYHAGSDPRCDGHAAGF